MREHIVFLRIILVSAPVLFLTVSCRTKDDSAATVKTVQCETVMTKEVKNEITGFGALSYKKKVDIAATQDAVIKKIPRREGGQIKEGDALVILENPQITLAVRRAENNFSQAQADLTLARARLLESEFQAEAELLGIEKSEEELSESWKQYREEERKMAAQKKLFEAGGIPEETMRGIRFSMEIKLASLYLSEKELDIRRIGFRDKDLTSAGIAVPDDKEEKLKAFVTLATARARAELEGAEARLAAAEKELDSARLAESEMTIRSPFSGVIAARYLEESERVKREDAILTIIDDESLYAVISVPESDAFRMETGMKAVVEIDGLFSSYNGVVDLISPVADNKSFTFSVRVLISKQDIIKETETDDYAAPNAETKFAKPGMFARVSVNMGPPRTILAVKDAAIINKSNKTGTVFIVHEKTVAERKVSLGELAGDEWEITGGLTKGEMVVQRPASDLQEGEYVSLAE